MAKKKYHELFFGLDLNEDQKKLRDAIFDDNNQIIIVDAVAGSGKTLVAVACAKQLIANHPDEYDGAVYIFPVAEEGTIGYRPGTTAEKEADYLEPLRDALITINEIPERAISSAIADKNSTSWVVARSAVFMRGINLKKKVIICDEMQNLEAHIIKRILSRAHDDCKIICLGCRAQTDIPIEKSGFKQFIDHMRDYEGCVKCELPISYRGRLAMYIDRL